MRRYEGMTAEQREYWEVRDRVEGGGVCCPQGVRVYCVCRASATCKVHGTICIGSHD